LTEDWRTQGGHGTVGQKKREKNAGHSLQALKYLKM